MVQPFLYLLEIMVILCLPTPVLSTNLEVATSVSPGSATVVSLSNSTTAVPVPLCPLGCLTCSTWNGCVDCMHNFTWHVEKVRMRKIGVCLRRCPRGYFTREFHHAPGQFRCIECKAANCAVCGERDFCDMCQEPYLEYRGTCILRCPEHLHHSKYRKDCFDKVDCLVSIWSQWTECKRDGQTCGYKWGNQTRTRSILQTPSINGHSCPATSQTQKCQLQQRYCDLENSAAFFSPSSRRHERRKEKRRRRCRLRKRAGRSCKQLPDNAIIAEPPLSQPVQEGRGGPSLSQTTNTSSYYDYYKQSAELLKLLNIRHDHKNNKKSSKS